MSKVARDFDHPGAIAGQPSYFEVFVSKSERKPKAPAHLQDATKRWWRSVVKEYRLEEHHLRLLQLAGEAWDRAQEARERLLQDGSYIVDRWNQVHAHPAVAVARDATTQFARLVREIDLDVELPATPAQPPALRRYSGGK